MSDLVAISYDDLATARRAVERLAESVQSRELELDDCVIVERRVDGTLKLHQPSLAGVGALVGAVWGGLIGLMFLVPLLGAAIGAVAGAAGGALSDLGVDDDSCDASARSSYAEKPQSSCSFERQSPTRFFRGSARRAS